MTEVSTGTTEPITPRQFEEAVEGWRAVAQVASTYFRTGSFPASARLMNAIGELAGLDDHHAEVDARPHGVTVRLITITDDYYGLSARDVELARQISVVAHDLGIPADPLAVQGLVISIDALVIPDVLPFWRAVLDFQPRADTPDEELNDPRQLWPLVYFNQMDAPRPQRNRIHFDVWVPLEQAEARVAAAIAAGGHLVTDENAPGWWVLADAEGNEVCVATWASID